MSKVLAFPTTSPVVKKVTVIGDLQTSAEREYNRMRTLETFLGLANSLKEGVLDIDDPQHVAYLVRRVIEIADEHKRREPKVSKFHSENLADQVRNLRSGIEEKHADLLDAFREPSK